MTVDLGANPHGILGAHKAEDGVVVRAYRPEAQAVRVQPANYQATSVEAELKDPAGLWEALLPKAGLPLEYELEVEYPDGNTFTVRDPYSFLPDARRARPPPGARGQPRAPLRAARRPRARDRRRRRHRLRRLGAQRAVGLGRRRLQLVGRAPAPDALARRLGIWELFVPAVDEGAKYKFEIRTQDGRLRLKADPVAFHAEVPPANASVVWEAKHRWHDEEWLDRRMRSDPLKEPISIYEVHLGSWRRNPLEDNRPLTYLELADELADYVTDLGFTHVELLPVMEHPFAGSWGYQVTGYYAPTSRFGTPDDFRHLVDRLHQRGIGVILDWVPAHFPRDDWALATFDGTHLYEHADPRRGAHPDWGTLVFNLGRTEVRNFLLANALYWLREHHADGLRVDAVASMLYLDYSRKAGEWVPNVFGGREDLDAVAFLKELNETLYATRAGRDQLGGGIDRLAGRLAPDLPRRARLRLQVEHGLDARHPQLFRRTTRSTGATTTTADVLAHVCVQRELRPAALSRRGGARQGSLLDKMPGDRWQKFANLRALLRVHVGAPRQEAPVHGRRVRRSEQEWNARGSLDWHLLEHADHEGIQAVVRDLNRVYRDNARALAARLRAGRLPLARGRTTPPTTFSPSPGSGRTTRRRSSACSTSRRCRATTTASGCRATAVGARC